MKKLRFLLLCFILLVVYPSYAAIEKTVKVTVGSSFAINPWSDVKSEYSGYTCSSTGVVPSDANVFSVSEYSRTKTRYPGYSFGQYLDGYYCSYRVEALKTGVYTVTAYVGIAKSSGTSFTHGTITVVYHVVVEPKKVLTSINIPNSLELQVYDEYKFSPVIYETGAYAKLSWDSSNSAVATIDASGNLKAVNVGSTIITCTAQNGVSAKCSVKVNPIFVSSVTINSANTELKIGDIFQLTATILPENATDKNVKWKSSDVSVATVDNNGLVTAVSSGIAVITAVAADGSGSNASCVINVLSDVLYAPDAVGVPGGTLTLPIKLHNEEKITGMQFELQLPDGVYITNDTDGNFVTYLSERARDHSVLCSKLSNGNYQFIVFSVSSSIFSGNDGALIYVSLNIGEEMPLKNYIINIKDVELTTENSEALHHKDMSTNLLLKSAMPGDTNGDGKITVTDAVSIVNHILERTPSVFITKSADVNDDGVLSITDAVTLINMILQN